MFLLLNDSDIIRLLLYINLVLIDKKTNKYFIVFNV